MSTFLDERVSGTKDRSSFAEILRWMPRGVRDFLTSGLDLEDAPQVVTDWLLKDRLVKKADGKTSEGYSYTSRGVEIRNRVLRRRDSTHGVSDGS